MISRYHNKIHNSVLIEVSSEFHAMGFDRIGIKENHTVSHHPYSQAITCPAENMLTLKDVLLLRWAFDSQHTAVYRTPSGIDEKSIEPFVRGQTDLRAALYDAVLASIAFLFMAGCAWAIFVTNANIIILIVCVPLGGVATLFWLIYGLLLVSEVVLGSK